MEDDFGLAACDELGEPRAIANIAQIAVANFADVSLGEKIGRRRRRQARPVTSAPSRCSHSDSQAPLKPVWPVSRTRLPRQNSVTAAGHYHIFHGALPDAQSSSSMVLSRNRVHRLPEPRCSKAIICPMAASRRAASFPSVSSPSMRSRHARRQHEKAAIDQAAVARGFS